MEHGAQGEGNWEQVSEETGRDVQSFGVELEFHQRTVGFLNMQKGKPGVCPYTGEPFSL